MSTEPSSNPDPAAEITACLADLDAYVPAEKVAGRLRAIEDQAKASPLLHARFLRAR
jgi:hypothetical protein